MNRDIKFRVWNKKDNEWDNPAILEVWDRSGVFRPLYEPYDNYIIQQYIGIKDKNGVEIYEGDIVEFENRTYSMHAEVKYDSRKAAFTVEDRSFDDIMKYNDLIVVGNVFENKE